MIKTFIMGVILGLLSVYPQGEEPYEGAELDLNTRGSNHSAAYSQSTGDIFLLDRSTHELYKIGMDGSVEILDALEEELSNRRRMEITTSGDALLFWDIGVGRVFR
ncbi:MAG: hypothetical protein LAT80_10030, partial [Balneolaceae bacterium]|nr:hypothetical protein [Balneolaceae bacterium]